MRIFVIIYLESTTLQMVDMIGARFNWFNQLFALHHDLIHLVVVKLIDPGEYGIEMYLERCLRPLYFVNFDWLPFDYIPPESIWVYDVCFNDQTCRHVVSIDSVTEFTRTIRKDFRGNRLLIRNRVTGNTFFGTIV